MHTQHAQTIEVERELLGQLGEAAQAGGVELLAGPRLDVEQSRVRGVLVERIVVALDAANLPLVEDLEQLAWLRPKVDDVAEAHRLVDAEPIDVGEHRVEGDHVRV